MASLRMLAPYSKLVEPHTEAASKRPLVACKIAVAPRICDALHSTSIVALGTSCAVPPGCAGAP